MMFWLTEGEPDNWPTVVMSRHDGAFERWNMPMTSFLAKIIKGEIACIVWDKGWFSGVKFEPRK
jgi:hypothetical protein